LGLKTGGRIKKEERERTKHICRFVFPRVPPPPLFASPAPPHLARTPSFHLNPPRPAPSPRPATPRRFRRRDALMPPPPPPAQPAAESASEMMNDMRRARAALRSMQRRSSTLRQAAAAAIFGSDGTAVPVGEDVRRTVSADPALVTPLVDEVRQLGGRGDAGLLCALFAACVPRRPRRPPKTTSPLRCWRGGDSLVRVGGYERRGAAHDKRTGVDG
jgi:hypothetical protein